MTIDGTLCVKNKLVTLTDLTKKKKVIQKKESWNKEMFLSLSHTAAADKQFLQ